MGLDVQTFRKKLQFGGARGSLFLAEIEFPGAFLTAMVPTTNEHKDFTRKFSFSCKTTSLPASNLSVITTDFYGRKINLPSIDRTFDNLQVTILNDEDFALRRLFERWIEHLAPSSHVMATNAAVSSDPEDNVYGKLTIRQLTKQGGDVNGSKGIYIFEGAFPTSISSIDLNWGTADAIEEFTIDFAYQYWRKPTQAEITSGVIQDANTVFSGMFGTQA